MKFMNIRSKVFYKYFLSYLFIFSIPVIVLGVVIYQNAVINLRGEIEASNINNLEQVKIMTDMRMKELEHIAARISSDRRLTSYMVKSDGYAAQEAIEELHKYKANSEIIDELFLYFHGDDVIYSSEGVSGLSVMTDDVYHFNQWDEEKLREDLNRGIPLIRSVNSSEQYQGKDSQWIAFVQPIPLRSPNLFGAAMFLIKESLLTELIDNILGDFQGNVYILDDEQNVLASKRRGTSLDIADVQDILLTSYTPGIHNVEINQDQYSLMSAHSEFSGWTFKTIMPNDQFLGRVAEVKSFVIIVIIFIVTVGLVTALILSFRQYRPIKDLAEYSINLWSHNHNDKNMNELERIKDTMDTAFVHHNDLLNQVDTQRPLIREHFLTQLLKGRLQSDEEIEELLSLNQTQLNGPNFAVMYISFGSHLSANQSIQNRENIIKILRYLSFQGGVGHGVELIHEHATVLILNMESSEDIMDQQTDIAEQILSMLQEEFHTSPVIGIGKTYNELLQINRSFIESSAAAEYKFINSKGRIIFFEDIKDVQDDTSWYPVEEQLKLVQSLKQGDQIVAKETLQVMMDSISKQEQSILLLKCMCFDIINTVFKTMADMNMKEYSHNVKSLLEFISLEELEEKLNQLIIEICQFVDNNKESHNVLLRNEILQHIHERFRSFELSLERLADQFQISVSYLSRFIKEQTGDTFTDYVMNLRIEEIRNALKTSNKPIKDIIADAGYVDVSSFNRKFKRIEGITPGEYRKLHS